MIRRGKGNDRGGDFAAQRPQPVINPMALQMEPDGPRKRALEVSHSRVLLGAGLFAVVFLVIAVRLVAITLLPDSFTAASADGTTQLITVTITGTNDPAAIGGTASASLTDRKSAE